MASLSFNVTVGSAQPLSRQAASGVLLPARSPLGHPCLDHCTSLLGHLEEWTCSRGPCRTAPPHLHQSRAQHVSPPPAISGQRAQASLAKPSEPSPALSRGSATLLGPTPLEARRSGRSGSLAHHLPRAIVWDVNSRWLGLRLLEAPFLVFLSKMWSQPCFSKSILVSKAGQNPLSFPERSPFSLPLPGRVWGVEVPKLGRNPPSRQVGPGSFVREVFRSD